VQRGGTSPHIADPNVIIAVDFPVKAADPDTVFRHFEASVRLCHGLVMSQMGHERRFDALPTYFRATPMNGHQQTGPVGRVRASNLPRVASTAPVLKLVETRRYRGPPEFRERP
jgi:hypothetical protein